MSKSRFILKVWGRGFKLSKVAELCGASIRECMNVIDTADNIGVNIYLAKREQEVESACNCVGCGSVISSERYSNSGMCKHCEADYKIELEVCF